MQVYKLPYKYTIIYTQVYIGDKIFQKGYKYFRKYWTGGTKITGVQIFHYSTWEFVFHIVRCVAWFIWEPPTRIIHREWKFINITRRKTSHQEDQNTTLITVMFTRLPIRYSQVNANSEHNCSVLLVSSTDLTRKGLVTRNRKAWFK